MRMKSTAIDKSLSPFRDARSLGRGRRHGAAFLMQSYNMSKLTEYISADEGERTLTLSDTIEMPKGFGEYLATRHYSPCTKRNYLRYVREFITYIGGNYSKIDRVIVRRWLSLYKDRGLSNYTLYQALASVKRFARYLYTHEADLPSYAHVMHMHMPRVVHRIPDFIPEEELLAMVRKVARHYKH